MGKVFAICWKNVNRMLVCCSCVSQGTIVSLNNGNGSITLGVVYNAIFSLFLDGPFLETVQEWLMKPMCPSIVVEARRKVNVWDSVKPKPSSRAVLPLHQGAEVTQRGESHGTCVAVEFQQKHPLISSALNQPTIVNQIRRMHRHQS